MRAFHVTAVISALLLCACAASRPAVEWARTKESALPYEQARQLCEKKAQAESTQVAGPAHGLAARAAGGIYMKCMREQGWEQRRIPE